MGMTLIRIKMKKWGIWESLWKQWKKVGKSNNKKKIKLIVIKKRIFSEKKISLALH